MVGTVGELSRALSHTGRAMPKVYAVDHGLVLANSPASAQDTGQQLETAVHNKLRRRHAFGRPGEITKLTAAQGDFEIDFLVGNAVMGDNYKLFQVREHIDEGKALACEPRALNAGIAERRSDKGWLLVGNGDERDIAVENGTVHMLPAWLWSLWGRRRRSGSSDSKRAWARKIALPYPATPVKHLRLKVFR